MVTKTFLVDDVGPPEDDVDVDDFFTADDDIESVVDIAPVKKSAPLRRSIQGPVKKVYTIFFFQF